MDTSNQQNPQQSQSVDPTALALSRAIRKQEGGDYTNISGDNGTSAGAYQWNNGKIALKQGDIPANFKSGAQEVGLDSNDFSQTNQDHVAYAQIKKDLDSGLSQSQVAAKWNSGLTTGWENHVGDVTINGKTVHYDTPAYVNNVKKFYQQEVSGGLAGQGDGNTGSTGTPQFPLTSQKDIPQPTPEQAQHSGVLGTNQNDSVFGKLTDNSLTRGLISAVPGADTLGKSIGTLGGYGYEKLKGLFGGKDNSENYDTSAPSIGDTALAAAKTVGTATAISGAGGLLSKAGLDVAFGSSKALANPLTKTLVNNFLEESNFSDNLGTQTAKTLDGLSSAEKVKTLTELASKAGADTKPLLEQAAKEALAQRMKEIGYGSFSELNPKLAKTLGISWKLIEGLIGYSMLSSGYSKAKGLLQTLAK